jgi:anti-anti-sigma regulatory factor
MSELTFISSAGLVALHVTALISRGEAMPNLDQGWTALKSVGTSREGGMQKHVKLLNPRKEIVDVLEMVGFSLFFEIFTDKEKAIESFS